MFETKLNDYQILKILRSHGLKAVIDENRIYHIMDHDLFYEVPTNKINTVKKIKNFLQY
jgi:homoaconitase/3-isopropylmalate dehydratase large subunit